MAIRNRKDKAPRKTERRKTASRRFDRHELLAIGLDGIVILADRRVQIPRRAVPNEPIQPTHHLIQVQLIDGRGIEVACQQPASVGGSVFSEPEVDVVQGRGRLSLAVGDGVAIASARVGVEEACVEGDGAGLAGFGWLRQGGGSGTAAGGSQDRKVLYKRYQT